MLDDPLVRIEAHEDKMKMPKTSIINLLIDIMELFNWYKNNGLSQN